MARYDNIVRVVRFLEHLGDSRAGITLRAAADELDVSERTARRYIEALERGGYAIDHDGGRYRLRRRDGVFEHLSEAERRQLVGAATAAGPLQGTPFAPDPAKLNERLFATPRQRELFSRLAVPLSVPHRLAIDYSRHEWLLRTLLKALDDKNVVRASYFTASRNQWTLRELDPYAFHYDPSLESLYLFAYCHLRREVRTFAAHRFREARILRRVFRRDPAFSVEQHLAGAFRMYRGKQAAKVVLAFSPKVAPWVGERMWHASQEKRALPGGGVELRFVVDGEEEIRSFVLGHGAEVRVVEPAWLAERVREEAGRVAGMYGEAVSVKRARRG